MTIILHMKRDYETKTYSNIVQNARIVMAYPIELHHIKEYMDIDIHREEERDGNNYKEYTCNLAWYWSKNYTESLLINTMHKQAIKLIQRLDQVKGEVYLWNYTPVL